MTTLAAITLWLIGAYPAHRLTIHNTYRNWHIEKHQHAAIQSRWILTKPEGRRILIGLCLVLSWIQLLLGIFHLTHDWTHGRRNA